MKKFLIAVMMMALGFSAVAEDGNHPLGKITGTNTDLMTYDHAFAGAINGTVAWGFLDEEAFTSELIVRKYQQTIKTTFKKDETRIGGTISFKKDDRDIALDIFVAKVDGANKQIYLNMSGEEVVVTISSEGYENGHFINPTFSAVMNGKEYSFTMEGEACMGMSMHFSMMLLGASLI